MRPPNTVRRNADTFPPVPTGSHRVTYANRTRSCKKGNPLGALTHYISQTGKGGSKARHLTQEEATDAMTVMLDGKADPFELGALLAALRIKEETAEELTAFCRVGQERLASVPGDAPRLTVPSYAGKRQTFCALIPAACILAAKGVSVGLHGLAAPPARMSLANTIAALGGNPNGSSTDAADSLARAGVAYVGIEQFFPVMHHMLGLREQMGLRSCFHTMARLINPFGARHLMVGVSHERTFEKLSAAAHALGFASAVSFRGLEGEAEANPLTPTEGMRLDADGAIQRFPIDPKALATGGGSRTQMTVDSAAAGAKLVRQVLAGEGPDIARHTATLTAACGLLAAGEETDLTCALAAAKETLSSGDAARRLDLWLKK